MIIGLAPMDGFTDCAFRQITKEIFQKYWEKKYELILRTEFMNADGYVINPPGVIKHLLTDKKQSPVIAQIFWGNEEMLMKCFADIQTKYRKSLEFRVKGSEKSPKPWTMNSEFVFSGIELNMWCSSRNVMNTGWWSALLKDRKTTLSIIKKLSWIMKMPFSIKTRIGLDEHDKKKQMDFLIQAREFIDMITIHGRTAKQLYAWEVDRDFIYELKNKCNPKCKIIGNWWITSYEQAINYSKWIYTSYSDFNFHESADQLKKRWLITDGKYLPYDPLLQERARELRKHMTPAEKKVWKQCFKFLDINILRQKVIDHYIVDFYIPSKSLVIEIDGESHFNEEAEWYDEVRTKILEAYWLEVIRITNDDVYNNFDGVCKIIENRITPSPSLSTGFPLVAKRGALKTSSFAKGGARRAEDFIIDGVMIGQAAVGNPRIFTPHTPSRKEIKETILRHLDYTISYENYFQEQMEKFDWTLHMPTSTLLKKSIIPSFNRSHVLISEFRKHLFQYVKWIPWSKEFKQKVSTISEYKLLVEEIQEFFSD